MLSAGLVGDRGDFALVKRGHTRACCPKPWHLRHWCGRHLRHWCGRPITRRICMIVPTSVTISSFEGRLEGSRTTTLTRGTPRASTISTKVSNITHPKCAPRSLMMGRSFVGRPGNWRVIKWRGMWKCMSKCEALKPPSHGMRVMILPSSAIGEVPIRALVDLALESLS